MSYLVLARKYRPQTFDDVVRQEHVTQTLTNAISSERMAHAILFSGPRGTGKTTIARILSKAVNCENGPTPTPCNVCRSCVEITSGSAGDVIEIDGASNNGVDHIRDLRENVKYMPTHSPYKIYIIDEVHMLSTAAFNALLKTLEEPPSHVMFLFATTEPHKIPITILSRCQRHDLRRVDMESIIGHMRNLSEKEEIDISGESLDLIARESGGCMRDALSLLDQVMTSSETTITHERVLDILGVIDRKYIFDIADGILKGDIAGIIEIFDDIYDHGHDIKVLYSELLEHFRNLVVVKMGKSVERLVDVPAHEIGSMKEQVRDVSAFYLNRLLDALFREEATIKLSAQPKLALEMAFFRMFRIKPVLPIDLLIEKIDELRQGVNDGVPVSLEPAGFAGRNEKPVASPPPRKVSEKVATFDSGPVQKEKFEPLREKEPEPPQEPGPSPEPAQEAEPKPVLYKTPEKIWEELINRISATHRSLGSSLSKCSLKNIADGAIEIEVNGKAFDLNRIEQKASLIEKVCEDLTGNKIKLSAVMSEKQRDENNDKNRADRLEKEALSHPLVNDAIEIFKGRIEGVTILGG